MATKNTSTPVKKLSSPERAALAKAAKLMAQKPSMRPATALRTAGIKSEAKVKWMSAVLRERHVVHLARSSPKNASPVSSHRGKKTSKSAKAASAGNGTSETKKYELPRAAAPKSATAPESHDTSTTEPVKQPTRYGTISAHQNLIGLWTDQNVRWWSEMMRWSPLGIMFSIMNKNGKDAKMVSPRSS